jgi:hypothetical protein
MTVTSFGLVFWASANPSSQEVPEMTSPPVFQRGADPVARSFQLNHLFSALDSSLKKPRNGQSRRKSVACSRAYRFVALTKVVG